MTIFGLILRVLLCAVGIYFVAAFVASLTRLLPFLTLGTSIALIFTIRAVREMPDGQSKIWILMVLTVAMVFFHRGTDYMEPHIVENMFSVVDVQRRWVSLYGSDDEYVIYLAPKTVGGFFENTFFVGICSYFFYANLTMPYTSWIVYIPAIYYLGMAVVDLLVVLGHAVGIFSDFPTILYWIARLAVIVTAIVIGITGGGTSTEKRDRERELRAKELFAQCAPLVKLDYTDSFEVDTSWRALGGDYTPTRFLYDAELDAGGLYRIAERGEEFYTVFAYDPRLGGHARFALDEQDKSAYLFEELVTKTEEHPRPFDASSYPSYENNNIAALCELTEHKIRYATQIIQRDTSDPLQILYASRHDNTAEQYPNYQVAFYFNTNDAGVPVSLRSIDCEIYVGDYVMGFVYKPLTGETLLEELFDPNNKTLIGYEGGEGSGEELVTFHEKVERAVRETMDAARYSVGQFDFKIGVTVRNRQNMKIAEALYAHDAGVQVSARYNEENFESSLSLDNNDFKTYPPDRFISNPHRTMYDSSYAPLPDEGPFVRFTGDDAITAAAIRYAFDTEYYLDKNDVEVAEDGSIVVIVKPDDYYMHGEDYFTGSGYVIHLEQRGEELVVTSVSVYYSSEERNEHGMLVNTWFFDLELYTENRYNIPAP